MRRRDNTEMSWPNVQLESHSGSLRFVWLRCSAAGRCCHWWSPATLSAPRLSANCPTSPGSPSRSAARSTSNCSRRRWRGSTTCICRACPARRKAPNAATCCPIDMVEVAIPLSSLLRRDPVFSQFRLVRPHMRISFDGRDSSPIGRGGRLARAIADIERRRRRRQRPADRRHGGDRRRERHHRVSGHRRRKIPRRSPNSPEPSAGRGSTAGCRRRCAPSGAARLSSSQPTSTRRSCSSPAAMRRSGRISPAKC